MPNLPVRLTYSFLASPCFLTGGELWMLLLVFNFINPENACTSSSKNRDLPLIGDRRPLLLDLAERTTGRRQRRQDELKIKMRSSPRRAPLLPPLLNHRRVSGSLHHHQPVQGHHLARRDAGRQLRRRRVRAPAGPIRCIQGSRRWLVRPDLGPDGVRLRRVGERLLRHWLLRDDAEMRHVGRHPRQPRRVHARRRPRLLRREPGGRLQPARDGAPRERARRQLQRGRVRRRPARDVPVGARREGGRPDRGVPERVRRVRHRSVLLPGEVRQPAYVPADALLQEVQGRLPDGVQLRLRRRQQPLHLLRRRLHHHLLRQQEATSVLVPQQSAGLQWCQQPAAMADHVQDPAASSTAATHLFGAAVCSLTIQQEQPTCLIYIFLNCFLVNYTNYWLS